ncbi:MAG: orotidine-5'-phosphate decarboxylase [Patescibacteria group bacterium]|nr:orotidine-5'-phosphate decarboxylase [Patescibacteria group bacterium]
MHIRQKLNAVVSRNNSLLCIGLDSDLEKLPESVRSLPNPIFAFNKAIIDATHDLVCCYKPNTAFYEAYGLEGIRQLKMTCDYLRETYPEVVIILDPKRGDIGSTNVGYARFAFDYLQGDCVTLQPYFGGESLAPFLNRTEKGCIIMCKNSNPDSGEFQNLLVDGVPLYMKVAEAFATKWNTNDNVWLVIGATYPEELGNVRRLAPNVTFLVPGIGAQGGDLEKTLAVGLDEQKRGIVIAASRGVIFASKESDFAEAARAEAGKLRDTINLHR